MNFVFVDETGDPGSDISKGASLYFGLALISVNDKDYKALRFLLSQVHWLRGTATSIELKRTYNKSLDLMRGLKGLANNGVISASGLYIDKKDYGGRYLEWADEGVSRTEWAYFLRNYLLRHLLEFHFGAVGTATEPIDLVLDRVNLTEEQRVNTYNYLSSKTGIPLRKSFSIPPVKHLTICDSEYVGGLESAHVLADVLKEIIGEDVKPEVKEVSNFMKVEHFVGHKGSA